MTKIYLVRHGQDEDNANGILNGHRRKPLTELGRKQANMIAEKLLDLKIYDICSSPLTRAMETAEIIAGILRFATVRMIMDLTERDFGVLTGRPLTDIPLLCNKIISFDGINYFLEADGAESYPDLYNRAKRVLDKIKLEYSHRNVVVVTHGDIGKMIRAVHQDLTWEQGLLQPHVDNCGIIELEF